RLGRVEYLGIEAVRAEQAGNRLQHRWIVVDDCDDLSPRRHECVPKSACETDRKIFRADKCRADAAGTLLPFGAGSSQAGNCKEIKYVCCWRGPPISPAAQPWRPPRPAIAP